LACRRLGQPDPEVEIVMGNAETAATIAREMFADQENALACLALRNDQQNRFFIVIHVSSRACANLRKLPAAKTLFDGLVDFAKLTRIHTTIGVVKAPAFLPSDRGELVLLGHFPPGSPGVTAMFQDAWGIRVVDPVIGDYGSIPPWMMSDRKPGKIVAGCVMAHELGHAVRLVLPRGMDRALEFENLCIRMKDPGAPIRLFER